MSEVRVKTSGGWINILVNPATLVRNHVTDEHNSYYAADAICALFALLSDSPLPYPLNLKPKRLFSKWVTLFTTGDLLSNIKRFSQLADQLLETERIHNEGAVERIFLYEMVNTPIFKEYHHFFRTGDRRTLQWIISVLFFLKKGKFERDDLQSVAFSAWLEVEEKLQASLPTDSTLEDLTTVISEMLPDPDLDMFYPKHGPGQVSEGVGRDLNKKHEIMFLDDKAWRLFSTCVNPLDNRNDYAENGRANGHEVERYARLRFVPKDISKSRSICMEPAYRMYLQQGILRMLLHAFDTGEIGRFVRINDQSRNQSMAQLGSSELCLDTIDLSSASDSVGWDLVKRVFPTRWVRLFAATRSNGVRVDDETVIFLSKFAPMGSAVCFPVQCILFLAVTVLASMRFKYGRQGEFSGADVRHMLAVFSNRPYDAEAFEPSVYGDDIICDSRVTDDVLQMLNRLRFTTNVDKSFISSQLVRESCGKYYHGGEDITPIRFTVPFHEGSVSPKAISSYIGGANNAYQYGYLALRRWYVRQTLYKPVLGEEKRRGIRDPEGRLRIAFVVDPNEFGLLCSPYSTNRNQHLRYRYNKDLQLGGWRSLNIGSKKRRVTNIWKHDAYSLTLYWRAKADSVGLTDQGHLSALPEDTRFVWGWTPKQ